MMSAGMELQGHPCYNLIRAVAVRLPLSDGAVVLELLEKHKKATMGSSEVNDLISLCIVCLDDAFPDREEEE